MSTINPAWRDLYPEDLAALLVVIARAHKMPPKAGKFIRMGKWGAERASSAIRLSARVPIFFRAAS